MGIKLVRRQALRPRNAAKAWSFGLLNITMLLALGYPILAITVQWMLGSAINFGGQKVIAAGSPQTRIFVLFWLGSLLILYLLVGVIEPGWHLSLFTLTIGALGVGSYFSNSFAVTANISIAGAERQSHRISSLPHSPHHEATIYRTRSQNSEQVFRAWYGQRASRTPLRHLHLRHGSRNLDPNLDSHLRPDP